MVVLFLGIIVGFITGAAAVVVGTVVISALAEKKQERK